MVREFALQLRSELIVIIAGYKQVRTSYLPGEILWGHRLAPLMTYQKSDGHYNIDYSQFSESIPTSMPEFSAERWSKERECQEPVHTSSDYPVSFTAPAIRTYPTSTSRRLFRRLRLHGSKKETVLQMTHSVDFLCDNNNT